MLRVNIIGQILVVFGLYHQISKIFCQAKPIFFSGVGVQNVDFCSIFLPFFD